MRHVVLFLAGVFLMVAGAWAYQQNYQTRAVLDEARTKQAEIAAARQRLGMLRAEWAYLNRPDRLRDLVAVNFERLELFPMRPHQFAAIGDLPMQPGPIPAPASEPASEAEAVLVAHEVRP